MNIQLKTLTMKTKITLLMAFVSFAFTSCIKDFHGHPNDKDGILTKTNYFYADDFKAQFLEIQIAKLDEEIEELKAGGAGPNDSKLILAMEKREEASNETIAIAAYRELVYRRRPPIPGPCPKIELCFPDIQYIVVPNGLDFFELIVSRENGEIIGRTEGDPSELGNVGGLIESVVFMSNGESVQGKIQIQIKERLSPEDDINTIVLDLDIGQ